MEGEQPVSSAIFPTPVGCQEIDARARRIGQRQRKIDPSQLCRIAAMARVAAQLTQRFGGALGGLLKCDDFARLDRGKQIEQALDHGFKGILHKTTFPDATTCACVVA